jgi:hypothetical protein
MMLKMGGCLSCLSVRARGVGKNSKREGSFLNPYFTRVLTFMTLGSNPLKLRGRGSAIPQTPRMTTMTLVRSAT